MANKQIDSGSVGHWAKRCYLAGRAMMDDMLRAHGIGATQWYILHQLARVGPTMQRDLVGSLQIERATVAVTENGVRVLTLRPGEKMLHASPVAPRRA